MSDKPSKPSPTICAKDPTEGCRLINQWAKEMYDWGEKVQLAIRALQGGGPTTVPPPPPPPFK